MTNNFTKYKKIIDYFRGEVASKDFETKFAAKSTQIPKSERFLLKMELKRLAAPCSRLVDLRGLVDGECKPFQHEERTHFLDDVAIKVFNENITLYGIYTVGVYEAITNTDNNFRVIYQKEKAGIKPILDKKPKVQKVFEKSQYPAKLYKFGEYHNRSEERMNFSITLLVTSQEGKVECHSSDISVNGCRFRLPSTTKMQIGQIISIRFLGLEEEFEFGSSDIFNYEVKNIQLVDTLQLVGVKRVYDEDYKRDGFKQFLSGFIQGNKRRYKINLDNTISALLTRNFEQYVLPKSNELPVFLSGEDESLRPKYALTCLNNHKIFEYWQDECKNSTLHFLITPDRIKRLKKAFVLGKSLLVYSFIHHSQGKSYFYSADEEQLKDDQDFMAEFLGFAANKADFAITTLTLSDVKKDKVDSFYTLSDSLTKKNQYLNLPVSEENLQKIDELTYLVVVNDITNANSTTIYQAFPADNINASKIKAFGHKRINTPRTVEEIGINYQNHRQESRFKFQTDVDVTNNELTLPAQSLDFSASGLKLEFDEATVLNKGDVVHLSFTNLQKITSLFDLKSLPYVIVRINEKKTIINLRVQIDKHKHIGKAFFKALIEKNKDKLTPDEYASMVQGLVKPLRNIYSSSLSIPNLIIQTSGSRYKFEALGCAQEYGKLMPTMRELSDKVGHYNLYPVLSNLSMTNDLMLNLKKMHATDEPISKVLYVAVNPDAENIEDRVITKITSELNTLKLQNLFMKGALRRGHFLCLQLKLSRTNVPDMDYLNPELSYISSYAIHRGKQVEQEVWNVAGVVQVLDITQEAMMRIKLGIK
ncbi:PilZ domain-containing protein [Pseudocolwellia sp. HL-MZ7]|uniref:PilZ domain-containing protein n=1 Tax=Pseudocolwellia sp. HL-MZ7 TaxID=3400627 RepID=UPI003CF8881D